MALKVDILLDFRRYLDLSVIYDTTFWLRRLHFKVLNVRYRLREADELHNTFSKEPAVRISRVEKVCRIDVISGD